MRGTKFDSRRSKVERTRSAALTPDPQLVRAACSAELTNATQHLRVGSGQGSEGAGFAVPCIGHLRRAFLNVSTGGVATWSDSERAALPGAPARLPLSATNATT